MKKKKKLRNIEARLDEDYLKVLTERQRRPSARAIRTVPAQLMALAGQFVEIVLYEHSLVVDSAVKKRKDS